MEDCEEWRAVHGYEGLYEASNCGRIRSLDRIENSTRSGTQYIRRREGKLLSPGSDRRGYLNAALCKDGIPFRVHVHALIALVFLGPCPEGMEIAHKDHNPRNNHLDNLEYVTHSENMRQSAAVARMGRLTIDEVQDIREIFAENPRASVPEIADILSITPQVISSIARGTLYRHVPNRDGSQAKPIEIKPSLTVEDITSLQQKGMSLPQIAKYYQVDYSTPYQILRRAGIHQPGGNIGTGRKSAKQKQMLAQIEGLPLFLK